MIVDQPAADWAGALGRRLHPGLGAVEVSLLIERTVDLGHGIQLAHLRVPGLAEARLAACKVTGGTGDWLLLVALLPVGEAARHLGWLAHLAAGLHREELCAAVRRADDTGDLAEALTQLLAADPVSGHRPAIAPAVPASVMRLVVVILKDAGAVDHLLNRFVEREIRGATIMDGRGMAEHLAAHLSLFAGFKTAFTGVGHSQVVLTVVPAERTDEVLALVQDSGDLRRPGTGIAFAIDLAGVAGFAKLDPSGV